MENNMCNCTKKEIFYKIQLRQDNDFCAKDLIDLPENVVFVSSCGEVSDFAQTISTTYEVHDVLIELAKGSNFDGWDQTFTLKEERDYLLEKLEAFYLILPVYAYIHSGVTISTSPYGYCWDSGQVGWIYVDKISAEKYGYTYKTLINFIKEYNLYLSEGVYGYSIQRWKKYYDGYSRYEDTIDSCGGFLGYDISENGILDDIDFVKYAIDKDKFLQDFKDDKIKFVC